MIRSLYSGISGLKNHQVKMDVIGNNIANVNTTGFKRSRVTFATALSQTLKGASSPIPVPIVVGTNSTMGGTNPTQIGLGVTLSSIDQIMTTGSTQTTGNPTDMMLQGPGFFVLNNSGQTVYSRAGAFSLDNQGNLVDPGSGALVQGQAYVDDTTALDWTDPLRDVVIRIGDTAFDNTGTDGTLTSYNIDQSGIVSGVYTTAAGVSTIHKIAQIAVANFANAPGLENLGGNFYAETNNSGTADVGAAGTNGRGKVIPNSVEMSNVDLSTEFTDMIVTQRGFQANSRVITVSDTLLEELINLKR